MIRENVIEFHRDVIVKSLRWSERVLLNYRTRSLYVRRYRLDLNSI